MKTWNTFKRCLDDDPSLVSVTGTVHFAGTLCFHKALPLIHVITTWSDAGRALRYLMYSGADVHVKDKRGRTPLHWSAGYNPDVAVAKCLVAHGADIHAEDCRGLTPFDVSFRYAKSDEVGLYFLELMTGSKGAEVTDMNILRSIWGKGESQ